MKITFLGTGAALADPDRCQSSILLTLDNGRNYLFDCGEGATRQMVRANVNPAEVNWVFLSHLHFDHICGLPFFVLSSWISMSLWVLLGFTFINVGIMWRGFKKLLAERHPDAPTRGLLVYMFNRSLMIRRCRGMVVSMPPITNSSSERRSRIRHSLRLPPFTISLATIES